jgi:predicted O-methyltransferase YrrM
MEINSIFSQVDKIEGWFTEYECKAISPYLPKSGLIVELGSYHGRSTLFFSLACPECKIITIDIGKQYDVKQTIPAGIDKIVADQPNVKQFIGDCLEVGKDFNETIDFLFIDTRHTFEDTYENLNLWSKKVREGGYIALHDYHSGFPGVIEAVSQFLKDHPEYSRIELGLGVGLIKL